jgi:hypothetical protein
MDLIPGKGLVPEGESFAEALQGRASGGGSRFLIQDDLQPFDHQVTHGRLLFGCGNFHALEERVRKVNRCSHCVAIKA